MKLKFYNSDLKNYNLSNFYYEEMYRIYIKQYKKKKYDTIYIYINFSRNIILLRHKSLENIYSCFSSSVFSFLKITN